MKTIICIEARPFACFSPEQMERLTSSPGLEIIDSRGKSVNDPDFVAELERAEVIISGNDLYVTEELLPRLGKLKLVSKLGVGLDMIDIPACTRHKVMVCNTPGANDVAVAEHTFALLLGLLRQVSRCDAGMRAGKWEQGAILGRELQGRTIGIVGLGAIGRCVAQIAGGFGMKIIGFDPYWPEAFAQERKITRKDIGELLAEADFVSVHCPLTPETADLIGEAQLKSMKPSAVIVNMARGGIVDEDALYAALKNKTISGAVLDAFALEPPGETPFAQLGNVLLSPHVGAFTEEALDKMSRIAVDQVFEYLEGKAPRNLRNPELKV